MKATCPKCETSYRVAAAKVPDVGAQIRCPKCSTAFVVRSSADGVPGESPAAEPPGEEETPPAELVESGDKPPAPAKTRSFARGVSAIRAQSGSTPRADGETLGGYRVRTARGQTYEFPSRTAMERWLKEREDLPGCEACEPGGDWVEADKLLDEKAARAGTQEYEDIEDLDPSKPIDVSRIKPLVTVPPGASVAAAEEIGPEQMVPSAGPRAGVLLWSTVALFALLMVAGAAATLTRYGILDYSAYLPLDLIGVEFPATGAGQDQVNDRIDDAPRLPEAKDPEERFSKALGAGRRALRGMRFSKAALEFKRALSVHSGSVEALEGLAKAFGGLGDRERAMDTYEKARTIKQR